MKEKFNPSIIEVITLGYADIIKTSGFEIGEEEDESVLDEWNN